MSHVMKALLKIILDGDEKKLETEICENQSEFRPGKGTIEGIFKANITKISRTTKACIYMFHQL